MMKRWILRVIAGGLIGGALPAPRPAHAELCTDLPPLDCPVPITGMTWTTTGNSGKSPQDIFQEKICIACHMPWNAAAFGPGSGQVSGISDWLNFANPKLLRRASYYLKGATKAEAAVCRMRDGTMPPGEIKPGSSPPPTMQQVKEWCDILAWVAQGAKI